MISKKQASAVRAQKVLLVGPSFSGGGAEGRFARLAGFLFGGTCDVAVFKHTTARPVPTPKRVFDLRWKGVLSYPRMVLKIVKLIRIHRYDVVMSFGMFPNLICILAARLSLTSTRVIIHEISRPLKLVEHAGYKQKLLYIGVQKALLPLADVITANSIDGLSEMLQICHGFQGITCLLSNAIDTGVIMKASQQATTVPMPLGPFIVCVARLDRMKRLDTVIEAYSHIYTQITHSLVIVGDGEALAGLKLQVEQLALGHRVVFTGAVQSPLSIVASASAFVIASEYEGFSNAVLEAMFLDVPVATSYCSSDAREICHRGAALGFEVGSARGLASQLLAILTEPDVSTGLVKHARIYRQTHVLEYAIPRYEALIMDLVNGEKSSVRDDAIHS